MFLYFHTHNKSQRFAVEKAFYSNAKFSFIRNCFTYL